MKPSHIWASELRDQGVTGIKMEHILSIQKDLQESLAKHVEETPTISENVALVEKGFAEFHAKRIRDFKIS
jgi:hypothetical protein